MAQPPLRKGDSVIHVDRGWEGEVVRVNRKHGTVQVEWLAGDRVSWHALNEVRSLGRRPKNRSEEVP